MADDRPGRGSDQFALRMPDGMRDRIKAAASKNGRSMNGEILATLDKEYPVQMLNKKEALEEMEAIYKIENVYERRIKLIQLIEKMDDDLLTEFEGMGFFGARHR